MKIVLVMIVISLTFTIKCEEENSSNENVRSRPENAELSLERKSLEERTDDLRTVEDSKRSEPTPVLPFPINRSVIDEYEADNLLDNLRSQASSFETSNSYEETGRKAKDETEEVKYLSKSAETEGNNSKGIEESEIDELVENSRSADITFEKTEGRQEISTKNKFSENEKKSSKEDHKIKDFFNSDSSSIEKKSDSEGILDIDESFPSRRMLSHDNPNTIVDTKARSGAPSAQEVETITKLSPKSDNLNEFVSGPQRTGKMNSPHVDAIEDRYKSMHTSEQLPIVKKLSQEVSNLFSTLPSNYYPQPEIKKGVTREQFQRPLPISAARQREHFQTPQYKAQNWFGSSELINGVSSMSRETQQFQKDTLRPLDSRQLENLSQEFGSSQNSYPYNPTSYPRPEILQRKPQAAFNPVTPNIKNIYYKLAQASDHPRKVEGNVRSSEAMQHYPDRYRLRYFEPSYTVPYTFSLYY